MLEDCELLIMIPKPQFILINQTRNHYTFLLIINKFVYCSNIKFVLWWRFSPKAVVDIAWRGCNLLADVSGIKWMKQNFLAQNFHPLKQWLCHIELEIVGNHEEERSPFLDHHYHQFSEHSSQMWYLGFRKLPWISPGADVPTVTMTVFVQVWHWEMI